MLAKVSEAFALKKAFPGALSGLHVSEETNAFIESVGANNVEEVEGNESKESYEELKKDIDGYTDQNLLIQEYDDIVAGYPKMNPIHKKQLDLYAKNHYNNLLKNQDNDNQ